MPKDNTPFFMDFAFELPKNVQIEGPCQTRDCTTADVDGGDQVTGCDDD